MSLFIRLLWIRGMLFCGFGSGEGGLDWANGVVGSCRRRSAVS